MILSKASTTTMTMCLLLGASGLSGQVLSGRVCDYRLSTEAHAVGIPGVTVTILQGGTAVATQATSQDGSYAFDGLPEKTPLEIRFERAGYLKYPTVKPFKVEEGGFKLADVFLLKMTDATSPELVAERLRERLGRKGASHGRELEILKGFGLDPVSHGTILASVAGSGYPGNGDEKPRIAVLEFKDKTETNSWHLRGGEAVQQAFVAELGKAGQFEVVERDQLATVMVENNLSLSGPIDTETAIRTGQILGVKYILFGAVEQYGESGGSGAGISTGKKKLVVNVDAYLIDTSSGEIVWAGSAAKMSRYKVQVVYGTGSQVTEDLVFDKAMKPAIQDLAERLQKLDLPEAQSPR